MANNPEKQVCIFTKEQLDSIKTGYDDWFNNVLKDGDREEELAGKYFTHSGIPVKMVHTPADVSHIDYTEDIGYPGCAPYVRGVYPNMYPRPSVHRSPARRPGRSGRLQPAHQVPSAAWSQRRQHPLRPSHDPRIYSDDAEAEGNVGHCGAAVDSIWDMDAYFKDIDLGTISTSIVTHLPSTSIVIPGMYFAVAEQRGTPRTRSREPARTTSLWKPAWAVVRKFFLPR